MQITRVNNYSNNNLQSNKQPSFGIKIKFDSSILPHLDDYFVKAVKAAEPMVSELEPKQGEAFIHYNSGPYPSFYTSMDNSFKVGPNKLISDEEPYPKGENVIKVLFSQISRKYNHYKKLAEDCSVFLPK